MVQFCLLDLGTQAQATKTILPTVWYVDLLANGLDPPSATIRFSSTVVGWLVFVCLFVFTDPAL